MPHTLDLARPESSPKPDNTLRCVDVRRRRRVRRTMGAVALCLLLGVCLASLVLAPSSASETIREGPILVVGDSLVIQATAALRSWNLPSVPIVADGGLGSAPCDWEKGYTTPSRASISSSPRYSKGPVPPPLCSPLPEIQVWRHAPPAASTPLGNTHCRPSSLTTNER